MYLPSYHQQPNLNALHELIHAYPLGAWVSVGSGGLEGNHIPFVLDQTRGKYGTLRGHVAKANPVLANLSSTTPSIVMFQGPQSYITPSWYPTKHDGGKVVPTWDYVAVHAHGVAVATHDKDWILKLVTDLTKHNESGRAQPWAVSDAPTEFINGLTRAIVGIEIVIDDIVGRWKLSQDEALVDRIGTAQGLMEKSDANSMALSALVSTVKS